MRLIAAALAVACGLLTGCSPHKTTPKSPWPMVQVVSQPEANLTDACISNFDPELDYFPERADFRHSSQLSVEYHRHYKRVTLRPAVSTNETVEMLLVQCGSPIPEHAAGTIVVPVPVARIATATRAMLGAAAEMELVDRFVGVSDPRAIAVPAFKKRAEEGALVAMGGHAHSNIEPILGADPDIFFTFHSAYPQFNIHPRLWTLGIRAIPHADSLEATPLGRAEWMKLLGMLTNTEARANALFDRIERPYEAIARMVRGVPQRPLTLAGTASQRDVMELFGGANHRAALLRDAGGTFVLEGNTFPGSWYITSFERVYAAGADAPFWIGVRPGIPSVQALVAANPHHRWFETAIGSGQVYALDVGYRGMFAYHLEDQGLNNPHLQLAELVAVLHPGLAGRTKTAIESFFVRKLQ